jgi:putative membrane protein
VRSGCGMKTIAFATLFIAAAAWAAPLSKSEINTAKKLGQGGESEVLLGRIVAKEGTGKAKEFAERMVTDHGKGTADLLRIAKENHFTVPRSMDDEHKKFEAKLDKESRGRAYDRTYIDEMVKDHKKDLQDFEKASKEVRDPELKRWVEENKKVVEEHLDMAEKIQKELQ